MIFEDGTKKTTTVKYISGNTYSFQIYIDSYLSGKIASVQVELANIKRNIKTETSNVIGFISGKPILYTSKYGELSLQLGGTYVGNISTKLSSMKLAYKKGDGTSLTGYIYVSEVINGQSVAPAITPKMTLKLDNGKTKSITVKKYSGNKYSFKVCIDGLVTGVPATIQTTLTNTYNSASSSKKKQLLPAPSSGKLLGFTITNKLISYTNRNGSLLVKLGGSYKGNINTKLSGIRVGYSKKLGNYISGEVYVSEVVDRLSITTYSAPKITLKLANGKTKSAYVKKKDANRYYFRINIDNLSSYSTAQIVVKLANNKYNKSTIKSQVIKTNSKKYLGKTKAKRHVSYSNTNGNIVLYLNKKI